MIEDLLLRTGKGQVYQAKIDHGKNATTFKSRNQSYISKRIKWFYKDDEYRGNLPEILADNPDTLSLLFRSWVY